MLDGQQPLKVRILATSDLHMCLSDNSVLSQSSDATAGLHRLASKIAAHQKAGEADICLLFDNGDLLQGSPLADYLATAAGRSAPHPVASMLNDIGYDAMGLEVP